jgi:aminoglycoside 6'-N-acetyltransferase
LLEISFSIITQSSSTQRMAAGIITLREATIKDQQTLKYWDEQPHVKESDQDSDWNWEVELLKTHSWREFLIAELDGTPIGFIQIIDPAPEETHYWGEIADGYRAIDIWIGDLPNIGKGYGRVMMHQALDRCFRYTEVHTVLIDPLSSNVRAIRFYERLGFTFIEDRRFGEDDCKVYAITRSSWEKMCESNPRGKANSK